jgi:hypothetical protein
MQISLRIIGFADVNSKRYIQISFMIIDFADVNSKKYYAGIA